MNLLSILKSNGTGLLEGLCRPHNHIASFFDFKPFDKMKIDFSMGVENLGTYEVQVDSIEEASTSTVINCTIIETRDEGMGVLLKIIIKNTGDFGRFEASDYR